MELSLKSFFQDCNASKFVVYLCLLLFCVLVALKADHTIEWPFWLIFFPLWIWKILVFSGAVVACVVHSKDPPARTDVLSELEYRSMLLSVGEHLFLVLFELLCCYKLDSGAKEPIWVLVFVPLLFQSFISLVVCIWAVKRDKSFEFELFFSVNAIQFVFISLRLDNLVDWTWVVILIPIWIVICLSLIGVLYAIVLAVLLIRSIDLLPEHRRQHMYSAMAYIFLVVPILVFLVLLTSRLDGESDIPYVLACAPLYVSLLCLMLMACATKGGNSWWFGIRQDFCHFLLDSSPCLQMYTNVSYRFGASAMPDTTDGSQTAQQPPPRQPRTRSRQSRTRSRHDAVDCVVELAADNNVTILAVKDPKPICPIVSIENPD